AIADSVGTFIRELFVQGYVDHQGQTCSNGCGVGRTLMCHLPPNNYTGPQHSHHVAHYGEGSHNHYTGVGNVHCVKNKDVNKKLQGGQWVLGPCPPAKQALEVTAEGFSLTAQPNPFSESTTISFRLTGEERVSLSVFNVAGEEVAKLFEGVAEKDHLYSIEFKASQNPDGMYFYRLVTEAGDVYIRKLVQTK